MPPLSKKGTLLNPRLLGNLGGIGVAWSAKEYDAAPHPEVGLPAWREDPASTETAMHGTYIEYTLILLIIYVYIYIYIYIYVCIYIYMCVCFYMYLYIIHIASKS